MSTDAYMVVLEAPEEHHIDGLWTSRRHPVSDGRKEGLDRNEVERAIEAVHEDGQIVCWHGRVASTDLDRIQEIIDDEREGDTRGWKYLIEKC